ncbi:Uncharacterised protein [Mycobacteroides abscessus subsp. abscessus]|uniref:DUF4192 domain-containing protein n=1 Tax=Mycobacteroides abscessus TaxID=36809 RepID=UPI000927BB9F|nr:DUF4192 domain-containing protein [Mycobacteroides abscessus]SIJ20331.1 Uncharacterised protein [Mycobacteroides abscessus subsp. abscessus]SLH39851.1 Uncharacterised protein [Mycobacteroides abscessus subsp. abscessus]
MHTIESPSQLIEGIPALIGFPPVSSLVLVTFCGRRIGVVLRVDLEDAADVVDRIAGVAARQRADSAVAVIVDAEHFGNPSHHELLGDVVAGCLAERGIGLLAVHVVDRIEQGGHWRCVDNCGAGGLLGDPTASPLAATAVAAGRRLYGDSDELKAMVEPDPDRVAVIGPLVEAVRVIDVADAVAAVVAVADRMAGGESITDEELAAVGASLVDGDVRDRCYRLAATERASAAEALWTVLARVLPDRWRVEALVLLAVAAFVRGDGAVAAVAVEAALGVVSGHRMAL